MPCDPLRQKGDCFTFLKYVRTKSAVKSRALYGMCELRLVTILLRRVCICMRGGAGNSGQDVILWWYDGGRMDE